ncbi:peptidylprolyl isomerase [Aureimonas mangrovi]|uniref:peptidylprolyl isomerase n=1 Tax=Aureimonas mangrovi TaxID=2758041 RepID=UPI00163D7BA1|nr:peptidylprolyl isomerase [Aureimonas mangrovi]
MTLQPLARACAGALLLSSVAWPALAQDAAPAQTPAVEAPAAETPEGAAPAAEAPAEAPAPETVVARVGTSEITESDIAAAAADLGPQFGQLPPEQRRIAILAALIDIRSLSLEAAEAGLDQDPMVERRVAFLRDRALHNAYFEREGVDAITDDELRARYEQEIAALEPVEEIHARHILLETEEEAREVIAELDGGADFEAIATERSNDPGSGQQGGDLGFFRAGQMVPAFEEAAFELEPGSYTEEPVETQFGWHVIQLVEKRESQPPAFEDVREEVMQIVMREKYIEVVQAARADLEVEYVDPAVQAQIEAMEAMMSGEPEAAEDAAADEAAPAPAEAAPDGEAPAEQPAQ